MARKKVARNGAGQSPGATEPGQAVVEAVKLARLAGNVAVLRELDALARALLREMEEDDSQGTLLRVKIQLLGTSRQERIAKMIRLMEMLPDVEAFHVARAWWPYIAPEFFPRPHLSLVDARARRLLPALSDIDRQDRRLLIQQTLNAMRDIGRKLSTKDERRFWKTRGEMPSLDKDRFEMAAQAARSHGLSGTAIDSLLRNYEHVAKSRKGRIS